ncbi:hypothetical protein AAFF_G00387350 [Aldrovandia affinis]|uniref:Uncharacterized protein n=1 Tax=Aldrovandia affinis TaxID=143900 RepID=A0AAD7SER6_9TELE|nr:hypothetical protein AAFF_G00387350 [Aldrovandia affinis]
MSPCPVRPYPRPLAVTLQQVAGGPVLRVSLSRPAAVRLGKQRNRSYQNHGALRLPDTVHQGGARDGEVSDRPHLSHPPTSCSIRHTDLGRLARDVWCYEALLQCRGTEGSVGSGLLQAVRHETALMQMATAHIGRGARPCLSRRFWLRTETALELSFVFSSD